MGSEKSLHLLPFHLFSDLGTVSLTSRTCSNKVPSWKQRLDLHQTTKPPKTLLSVVGVFQMFLHLLGTSSKLRMLLQVQQKNHKE
jgi:hypothetical protein